MPGATFKLVNAYREGTPATGRYRLKTLLATGDVDGNTYQNLLYASQLIISAQGDNAASVFVGGEFVTPDNYGVELEAGGSTNSTVPIAMDDYLCMDVQEVAPGAPTAANGAAGTNLLEAGVYRWKITFVTADGETEAGTASSPLTVDPATELPPALSAIPLGSAAVTARNVYRTEVGGSVYKLSGEIADNTTTVYTDNVADASLGATAPAINDATPMHVNIHWHSRYPVSQ